MWRASVAGNIREEQKEVTWESQAWASREIVSLSVPRCAPPASR